MKVLLLLFLHISSCIIPTTLGVVVVVVVHKSFGESLLQLLDHLNRKQEMS